MWIYKKWKSMPKIKTKLAKDYTGTVSISVIFCVLVQFFTNSPQYKNANIANLISAVPLEMNWTILFDQRPSFFTFTNAIWCKKEGNWKYTGKIKLALLPLLQISRVYENVKRLFSDVWNQSWYLEISHLRWYFFRPIMLSWDSAFGCTPSRINKLI